MVLSNLWVAFLHRQDVVAKAAVVAQRLSVFRDVVAVVAAEAARISHVADVVWISTQVTFMLGNTLRL